MFLDRRREKEILNWQVASIPWTFLLWTLPFVPKNIKNQDRCFHYDALYMGCLSWFINILIQTFIKEGYVM
jgi:hypothetical protein